MARERWEPAWLDRLRSNPHEKFDDFQRATGFNRTREAWRKKRISLGMEGVPNVNLADQRMGKPVASLEVEITDNSLMGELNWRRWNDWIKEGQVLRKTAKGSPLEDPAIRFITNKKINFIVLGDTHIGAWSTDHELFEKITDEILSIPDLYIALVGDLAHMAIKLRNVVEVGDNLLPADVQLLYLQSWLYEMQERILFATWGNHEVERAETQAGLNPFGELYKRTCRHYFNGIGHVTLSVNDIDYNIAVSHTFQGRSMYSPVHGAQRYLTFNGNDRDIAIAGDSHVPGVLKFVHSGNDKLAVNCGSIQTMSGYAQRYFSLKTHPIFPVITLDHEEKAFWASWSVKEWLRARE